MMSITMKKKILLPLLALMLVASGCSGKNQDQPDPSDSSAATTTQESTSPTVQLQSASAIEEMLSSTGWQTQTTSAASFHLWEQYRPSTLILAENRSDEVLIVGEFSSEEDAQKAYESLVPSGKDAAENQDSATYQQALVALEDGSGYWLFRQIGTDVFAGCMEDASDAPGFATLFTSFEVGGNANAAPNTGSDETTGPSGTGTENAGTSTSGTDGTSDADASTSESNASAEDENSDASDLEEAQN